MSVCEAVRGGAREHGSPRGLGEAGPPARPTRLTQLPSADCLWPGMGPGAGDVPPSPPRGPLPSAVRLSGARDLCALHTSSAGESGCGRVPGARASSQPHGCCSPGSRASSRPRGCHSPGAAWAGLHPRPGWAPQQPTCCPTARGQAGQVRTSRALLGRQLGLLPPGVPPGLSGCPSPGPADLLGLPLRPRPCPLRPTCCCPGCSHYPAR